MRPPLCTATCCSCVPPVDTACAILQKDPAEVFIREVMVQRKSVTPFPVGTSAHDGCAHEIVAKEEGLVHHMWPQIVLLTQDTYKLYL